MSIIAFIIVACVWSYWVFCVYKLFKQSDTIDKFFQKTAFVLPFYSVSFGLLGFQFSIYKLLPIVIFLYAVTIVKRVRLPLIVIGLYFSIVTLACFDLALYMNLFDESIERGREPNTVYVRVVVQHILFTLSILQIWAIGWKEKLSAHLIFRSYVYGCLLLVVIGYLQLTSYHLDGPWFDFWWLIDALSRTTESGMAQHAFDHGLYRMSSLGGEPRHFASILSLGFLLLLYLRDTVSSPVLLITGRAGIASLIVLFSGIVLSVSSSGLGVLLLSAMTYLLFTARFVHLFIGVIFSLMMLLLDFSVINNIIFKFKSIDIMMYAAPKDAFAFRMLFDNLAGFIFGFGVNLAEFFSPEIYLASNPFANIESTFSPTSPILQILVNGGIVGLLLITWYVYMDPGFTEKNRIAFAFSTLAAGIVGSSLLLTLGFFFLAVLMAEGRSCILQS